MIKTLILMRGLPGSCKSTLAHQLRERHITLPGSPTAIIASTDDFFTNAAGIYSFKPERLHDYHRANQDRVANAMKDSTDLIIVDNTNTTWREMKAYVDLAMFYGYKVKLAYPSESWSWNIAECAKRNTHGVPETVIRRMAERFQTHQNISMTYKLVTGCELDGSVNVPKLTEGDCGVYELEYIARLYTCNS